MLSQFELISGAADWVSEHYDTQKKRAILVPRRSEQRANAAGGEKNRKGYFHSCNYTCVTIQLIILKGMQAYSSRGI